MNIPRPDKYLRRQIVLEEYPAHQNCPDCTETVTLETVYPSPFKQDRILAYAATRKALATAGHNFADKFKRRETQPAAFTSALVALGFVATHYGSLVESAKETATGIAEEGNFIADETIDYFIEDTYVGNIVGRISEPSQPLRPLPLQDETVLAQEQDQLPIDQPNQTSSIIETEATEPIVSSEPLSLNRRINQAHQDLISAANNPNTVYTRPWTDSYCFTGNTLPKNGWLDAPLAFSVTDSDGVPELIEFRPMSYVELGGEVIACGITLPDANDNYANSIVIASGRSLIGFPGAFEKCDEYFSEEFDIEDLQARDLSIGAIACRSRSDLLADG